MRWSKAKLVALSAIVFSTVAWLGAASVAFTWLWMTGALVANGRGDASFTGKPAATVSVYGAPSNSLGSRAGVYHVLVIFPADSVTWVVAGSTSGDVIATTHDEWKVWARFGNGEPVATGRSLDSQYNALLSRVTIRGHHYSLARGNLFVARFGDGDRVEVVQIPRHVSDTRSGDVVKTFQAFLPNDPVVRDLYRYPKVPCPRRPASAARTSEA
ncbi:MAG TPA: hypothetical protein VFJ82_22465 [Longimicrobium sp.]|nr:hypothetical protein [Longimicrobium sp.]